MEKITEILDKLDLAKFVPELDKLMELVLKCAKFSVRVGPICILLLGFMLIIGLFLNGAAKKAAQSFTLADTSALFDKVFALVITQIKCVLVIFVFMILLTAVVFNRKGVCRFKALENTGIYKLLTCNVPKTVRKLLRAQKKGKRVKPQIGGTAAENAVENPALESAESDKQQGEQTLSAEDIVIEYQ